MHEPIVIRIPDLPEDTDNFLPATLQVGRDGIHKYYHPLCLLSRDPWKLVQMGQAEVLETIQLYEVTHLYQNPAFHPPSLLSVNFGKNTKTGEYAYMFAVMTDMSEAPLWAIWPYSVVKEVVLEMERTMSYRDIYSGGDKANLRDDLLNFMAWSLVPEKPVMLAE